MLVQALQDQFQVVCMFLYYGIACSPTYSLQLLIYRRLSKLHVGWFGVCVNFHNSTKQPLQQFNVNWFSASATHLVAAQSNQSNNKYCMLQGMPGSKNTGNWSHTACNYSSTGDLAALMLAGLEFVRLFATARGNQSNNSDPCGNTRMPSKSDPCGDTRMHSKSEPGSNTCTHSKSDSGDTRMPGGNTHTPGGNTRTSNGTKGLPATRS